jgi:hypothetical protein
MGGDTFDQSGTSSEIGALGRLKLSSRIVLRVHGEGSPPPDLLREAVFTHFRSSRWLAHRREFQPSLPLGDTLNWPLSDIRGRRQLVTIQRYSRAGSTPLALPGGTAELLGLAATTLETNRLTAARAESLLPLSVYTVVHGPDAGFDDPPDADDLDLDSLALAERDAIRRVVDELNLGTAAPPEALRRVQSFFATNYGYSLENRAQAAAATNATTALTEFLGTTREGHCEYFATATTLLLRAAGVPTRYVVGWSVQETQRDGFVVRARHAHAWCIAHVNGRWQPVDNTPSNWAREEARLGGHWWEPVYDQLSNAWLWFTRFRQGDSRWRLYVFVGGIFLLAFMGWRELRGGRWRQTGRNLTRRITRPQGPGHDSEFYALLATLEKTHAPRPPTAPLRPWLQSLPLDGRHAQLDELLLLHYRLRFDPKGLDDPHRLALKEGVRRWLQDAAR